MGDELLVDGYAFKVVKMRRSRISIVQVKKLPSVSCEESVTTADSAQGRTRETCGNPESAFCQCEQSVDVGYRLGTVSAN